MHDGGGPRLGEARKPKQTLESTNVDVTLEANSGRWGRSPSKRRYPAGGAARVCKANHDDTTHAFWNNA